MGVAHACQLCCDVCLHRLNKSSTDGYEPIKQVIQHTDDVVDMPSEIWRWIEGKYTAEQLMVRICQALGNIGAVTDTATKPIIGTAIAVGALLGKVYDYFSDSVYSNYFPQQGSEQQSLIEKSMRLLGYETGEIASMTIGGERRLKRKCKRTLQVQGEYNEYQEFGEEYESESDLSTDSDMEETYDLAVGLTTKPEYQDKEDNVIGVIIHEYVYTRRMFVMTEDTNALLQQRERQVFAYRL